MQNTPQSSKSRTNQEFLNVNEGLIFDAICTVNKDKEDIFSSFHVRLNRQPQYQSQNTIDMIEFNALDESLEKMLRVSSQRNSIDLINNTTPNESYKSLFDQLNVNQYQRMKLIINKNRIDQFISLKKGIGNIEHQSSANISKHKIKKKPMFHNKLFKVTNTQANSKPNKQDHINGIMDNNLSNENKIIIPINISQLNQLQANENNQTPQSSVCSFKKKNPEPKECNEDYLMDIGSPTRSSSKVEGNSNKISRKLLKKIKHSLLELDNKYQTTTEKGRKHYVFALNDICYSLIIDKKKKTILSLTKTAVNVQKSIIQNEVDIMKEMILLKESIQTMFLNKKRLFSD